MAISHKIRLAALGAGVILAGAIGRLRARRRGPSVTGNPRPVTGGLVSDPDIDAAVVRASHFLRRRLRSGTYGLGCVGADGLARFSDNKGHVFVAAFIAEALAGTMSEIDRALLLVRILSEENGGHWGFSPPGPYHGADTMIFHVDADDTAYVIRTLRRLGVNRPPDPLLQYYRASDRLFVTFDTPGPTALSVRPSSAHNLLAHPEVNANVILALRGTHHESFAPYDRLAAAQDGRGCWPSYFYPDPLFGTVLAIDALGRRPKYASTVRRGLRFVAGSQNVDGSWGDKGDPYATALAVAALAGQADYAAEVRRGTDFLLATMKSDGSWSSESCIWEFRLATDDIWRAFDSHGAYVSSRCLIALRRATGTAAVD